MVYQLAVLYFSLFIAQAIFLAGSAFVATRFKVPILVVKLGVGPKLFNRGKFTICPLPISAFVRMLDTRESGVTVESERAFDRQPRLVRVAIVLSGPIALLLAAVALRGTAGWESFQRAFEQILSGAFAPASHGMELAGGYLRVVERMGSVTALGVVLAKMAAANLLPIPIVGGGMALMELLLPSAPSNTREKIWAVAMHAGLVATLVLLLPWLYAIVLAVMAR